MFLVHGFLHYQHPASSLSVLNPEVPKFSRNLWRVGLIQRLQTSPHRIECEMLLSDRILSRYSKKLSIEYKWIKKNNWRVKCGPDWSRRHQCWPLLPSSLLFSIPSSKVCPKFVWYSFMSPQNAVHISFHLHHRTIAFYICWRMYVHGLLRQ